METRAAFSRGRAFRAFATPPSSLADGWALNLAINGILGFIHTERLLPTVAASEWLPFVASIHAHGRALGLAVSGVPASSRT